MCLRRLAKPTRSIRRLIVSERMCVRSLCEYRDVEVPLAASASDQGVGRVIAISCLFPWPSSWREKRSPRIKTLMVQRVRVAVSSAAEKLSPVSGIDESVATERGGSKEASDRLRDSNWVGWGKPCGHSVATKDRFLQAVLAYLRVVDMVHSRGPQCAPSCSYWGSIRHPQTFWRMIPPAYYLFLIVRLDKGRVALVEAMVHVLGALHCGGGSAQWDSESGWPSAMRRLQRTRCANQHEQEPNSMARENGYSYIYHGLA